MKKTYRAVSYDTIQYCMDGKTNSDFYTLIVCFVGMVGLFFTSAAMLR